MDKITISIVIVTTAILIGGIFALNKNQPNETANKQTLSNTAPTFTPIPTLVPTTTNTTPVPTLNLEQTKKVVVKTNKGEIVMALFYKDAPQTVDNFLKKVKDGYYNGLNFHRVEDWVAQGGDPKGDGTGGGQQDTELNDYPFITGSIGIARGPDIKVSNDSQFFITKKDARWLDKQYTNFGVVISGMDVVNKLERGDTIIQIGVLL